MKFIIAVVMLALAAINTNASLLPLPLAYSGYPLASSYQLAYAPRISLSQGYAGLSYAAPVPVAYSAQALSLPASVAVSPVAPVPVAVASPHVPSASYVATTRGAQHVAPLVGHVQSVSSQNVEPAPGTY
ncbi:adult cuticle protein 1-like [Contarinia nasturtii]|uniref:adult cuticle protein 1-like n=1 Tax=Contarinia nasturtii TaxID=265458 RepID=UPI0012D413A8|nr:adult cuticle protein 1-like [Contarinia nasturtii]